MTYGIEGTLPSPYSFSPQTGLFVWTPTYYDSGNYTITFTVSDGEATTKESISINVLEVNNKISLSGPALIGSTLSIQIEDIFNTDKQYILALSFGNSPGIPLGNKTIRLNPDALFYTTVWYPQATGLSNSVGNFVNGKATVRWAIPNITQLDGQKVYAAFVTIDPLSKEKIVSVSPSVEIELKKDIGFIKEFPNFLSDVPYPYYAGTVALEDSPDGGWIVAGPAVRNGLKNGLNILRLNSKGGILWSKKISPKDYKLTADSIIKTSDGNYLLLGREIYGDFFVVKFSPLGQTIWTKWFVTPLFVDSNHELEVAETFSGYIIFGKLEGKNNNVKNKALLIVSQKPRVVFFGQILGGCWT